MTVTKRKRPATEKELAAIEAVKVAIKALPRTIYMSVEDDCEVHFWKPHAPGSAHGVGTPLRRRQAFTNNWRR